MDTRELVIVGTSYLVPYRMMGDVIVICACCMGRGNGRIGSISKPNNNG